MRAVLFMIVALAALKGVFAAGMVFASGGAYAHPVKEWFAQAVWPGDARTVLPASVICLPEGLKSPYMCMFFDRQKVFPGAPRLAEGWFLRLESHSRAEAALGPRCWSEYLELQDSDGKAGVPVFACTNNEA